MPDTKGFTTFFDDYVVPKAQFRQVPTLDIAPNQKVDSSDAFVTHNDATVETPPFPGKLNFGTPEGEEG